MTRLYKGALWVSICAIFWMIWNVPALVEADQVRPKTDDAYQAVTGDSSEEDRTRWDAYFSTNNYVYGKEPSSFLKANISLLPVGRALDIAMAEGRNAVFLAKKGFKVDGVDISEVAIRKAVRLAREQKVTIQTINADLKKYQVKPSTYDVIINIQFLERHLFGEIKKGLKSGGVVVFENFTEEQLQNPSGKTMVREYLLKKGELREVFKDFTILFDRETNDGKEAMARFIARKP
jgi:tellurite methyltransferase